MSLRKTDTESYKNWDSWRTRQRQLAKLPLSEYRDNPVKFAAICKAKEWRDRQNDYKRASRERLKAQSLNTND